MSEETLELYVKQHIAAQQGHLVEFTWQGGEPSMRGLDFFKKAIALSKQYADGKQIHHSFQTNGIGLDSEWARFLAKNDVLVGLSIDGPQAIHDTYRVSRSGRGSYQQVVNALSLLKEYDVRFNVLTVVGSHNAESGAEVYEHFRELGIKYIQFIPIVERVASRQSGLHLCQPGDAVGELAPFSVDANQFGQFLCDVFDIWVRRDVGDVFVQAFDATLASWCGQPSGICVHSAECGHAFALEANGDLFQCDHFVYPEYKLGNIHQQTIRQLNNSKEAIAFGQNKRASLNASCQQCTYRFACHGGCPKHRFSTSEQGHPHHNYLCGGYQQYYRHTEPFMKIMRDLLKMQKAPSDIMSFLQLHYPTPVSKQ